MSCIAVIPARGGSKRIPHKNIKDFNGKPLISYSINTALLSGLFDEVVVSTDDEEIADTAREYGAHVPFMRDSKLADDFTGTFSVVKDAYKRLSDSGLSIDTVCCIYATAPLLLPKHLKEAYSLLNTGSADSVVSVCEFPFPIQRAFVIKDSILQYREPQFAMSRSQDLEKCYQDCGLFYFYRAKCFDSAEHWGSTGYVMPRHRVIDIDTPDDWDYACALYRSVNELNLE
ncbi:MAG: pseudaminic acid cytidylyltransferase [Succinivibrio sp.]